MEYKDLPLAGKIGAWALAVIVLTLFLAVCAALGIVVWKGIEFLLHWDVTG